VVETCKKGVRILKSGCLKMFVFCSDYRIRLGKNLEGKKKDLIAVLAP